MTNKKLTYALEIQSYLYRTGKMTDRVLSAIDSVEAQTELINSLLNEVDSYDETMNEEKSYIDVIYDFVDKYVTEKYLLDILK